MSSDRILRFLNPVLFVVMLVQASTGIAMGVFEFEPVHELHEFNGLLLVAVAATHIILNRRWIGRVYFGRG